MSSVWTCISCVDSKASPTIDSTGATASRARNALDLGALEISEIPGFNGCLYMFFFVFLCFFFSFDDVVFKGTIGRPHGTVKVLLQWRWKPGKRRNQ